VKRAGGSEVSSHRTVPSGSKGPQLVVVSGPVPIAPLQGTTHGSKDRDGNPSDIPASPQTGALLANMIKRGTADPKRSQFRSSGSWVDITGDESKQLVALQIVMCFHLPPVSRTSRWFLPRERVAVPNKLSWRLRSPEGSRHLRIDAADSGKSDDGRLERITENQRVSAYLEHSFLRSGPESTTGAGGSLTATGLVSLGRDRDLGDVVRGSKESQSAGRADTVGVGVKISRTSGKGLLI
jgi:hypothetical protein